MREQALAVVSALIDARPKFDALNDAARELYGDFYPHHSPVADAVYGPLVALLNAVLDGEADYFLHECQSDAGGAVEINGRRWRLKTISDFRDYLETKDIT